MATPKLFFAFLFIFYSAHLCAATTPKYCTPVKGTSEVFACAELKKASEEEASTKPTPSVLNSIYQKFHIAGMYGNGMEVIFRAIDFSYESYKVASGAITGSRLWTTAVLTFNGYEIIDHAAEYHDTSAIDRLCTILNLGYYQLVATGLKFSHRVIALTMDSYAIHRGELDLPPWLQTQYVQLWKMKQYVVLFVDIHNLVDMIYSAIPESKESASHSEL